MGMVSTWTRWPGGEGVKWFNESRYTFWREGKRFRFRSCFMLWFLFESGENDTEVKKLIGRRVAVMAKEKVEEAFFFPMWRRRWNWKEMDPQSPPSTSRRWMESFTLTRFWTVNPDAWRRPDWAAYLSLEGFVGVGSEEGEEPILLTWRLLVLLFLSVSFDPLWMIGSQIRGKLSTLREETKLRTFLLTNMKRGLDKPST